MTLASKWILATAATLGLTFQTARAEEHEAILTVEISDDVSPERVELISRIVGSKDVQERVAGLSKVISKYVKKEKPEAAEGDVEISLDGATGDDPDMPRIMSAMMLQILADENLAEINVKKTEAGVEYAEIKLKNLGHFFQLQVEGEEGKDLGDKIATIQGGVTQVALGVGPLAVKADVTGKIYFDSEVILLAYQAIQESTEVNDEAADKVKPEATEEEMQAIIKERDAKLQALIDKYSKEVYLTANVILD